MDTPADEFFLTSLGTIGEDAILVTRAEDIDPPAGPEIIYCNRAFERLTGWPRAEVMGRTPRILQGTGTEREGLDEIRRAMRAWNQGDEAARARVEVENKRRDGSAFRNEMSLAPLWDPERRRSYWIATLRDMTHRTWRASALDCQASSDTFSRRGLSDSIIDFHHECRTPLNAIYGFAQLLETVSGENLTAKQNDYVTSIKLAAEHLLAMANSHLGVMRSGAWTEPSQREMLPARDLVAYVFSICSQKSLERDVRLIDDLRPDTRIYCDPIRARQCLTNIVENAIKFSDSGAEIRVSAAAEAGRIGIVVDDQGPGMSADDLAVAMSRFGQAGAGRTMDNPGLGLGLAITRELMAAQGGEVRAVSRLGVGSTVALWFPAGPTASETPAD